MFGTVVEGEASVFVESAEVETLIFGEAWVGKVETAVEEGSAIFFSPATAPMPIACVPSGGL